MRLERLGPAKKNGHPHRIIVQNAMDSKVQKLSAEQYKPRHHFEGSVLCQPTPLFHCKDAIQDWAFEELGLTGD
jgi:hypothetical protein